MFFSLTFRARKVFVFLIKEAFYFSPFKFVENRYLSLLRIG